MPRDLRGACAKPPFRQCFSGCLQAHSPEISYLYISCLGFNGSAMAPRTRPDNLAGSKRLWKDMGSRLGGKVAFITGVARGHNEGLYSIFRPDLPTPTRDDVLPAFTMFQVMPIPCIGPIDIANPAVFLANGDASLHHRPADPCRRGFTAQVPCRPTLLVGRREIRPGMSRSRCGIAGLRYSLPEARRLLVGARVGSTGTDIADVGVVQPEHLAGRRRKISGLPQRAHRALNRLRATRGDLGS